MATRGTWGRLARQAVEAVRDVVSSSGTGSRSTPGTGAEPSGRKGRKDRRNHNRPTGQAPPKPPATGGVEVGYAPERDGDADPGEVVWAWVPYEDDPSQGKDRPVLILGWDGPKLAGVPLSSKDHDGRRDEHEWVPVGTGAWDDRGRPSFADASRLLRIDPSAVRREGAALHRERFDEVLRRVEKLHDWHR